jgi:hypothetical protein
MQSISSIVKQQANAAGSALAKKEGTPFFKPVIQPKLTINEPNDIYEQEADAVADKVMRMTDHETVQAKFFKPAISSLQRKCAACEEEEKKMQRKEMNSEKAPAGNNLESYVRSLSSGGQPLPKEVRSFYEPRLGYDFSNVKLHTDNVAAKSAQSINALAYTTGNNIVFNNGQYSPGTDRGKRLLGHELTHVVQQNTSAKGSIQRYSHQDCKENDLKTYVWPGDARAKEMVAKVIRVMGDSSLSSDPRVTALLSQYFMTSTPKLLQFFIAIQAIQNQFTANNYQYECEYDCGKDDAYVYGLITDIHLCINKYSGWTTDCVARAIIHEMGHYAANLDDEMYCNTGCGCSPCESDLSPSDALDNADSFACFAYSLWPVTI